MSRCTIPPEGWRCTRTPGHDGPCAALPSYMSPDATLWREIDALGGAAYVTDPYSQGHNEALVKVLAILERRGFSEFADALATPKPADPTSVAGEWEADDAASKERERIVIYIRQCAEAFREVPLQMAALGILDDGYSLDAVLRYHGLANAIEEGSHTNAPDAAKREDRA